MISTGTGYGGRRLDDIQPVHCVVRPVQFTAPREFARIAYVSRPTAEEIRIQRENNAGFLRPIYRVDVTSERQL